MRGSHPLGGRSLWSVCPASWVWPWSCVLPAAGRLGPLPGGSRRKKVPGGGDHPEPQAQVPPVQGEQEGLDNVSMTGGEIITLLNLPFLWLISKPGLYMPCRLSMRHAQRTNVPNCQSGGARGQPWTRLFWAMLCALETPFPCNPVRFAAFLQGA